MSEYPAVVVEDDASLLKLLGHLLAKAGFEVVEAQSGQEGLALLKEVRSDLLILDRLLPDGDGLYLCREAKQQEPLLVIWLVSGLAYPTDYLAGLDAGADDYFAKPFDLKQFLLALVALRQRWAED